MKKVKLFVKNDKGEVRRIDKMSGGILDKLPKLTDYTRRFILAAQARTTFAPYTIQLNDEEFAEFQERIGETAQLRKTTAQNFLLRKKQYLIVNDRGLVMTIVERKISQKENGSTGISKETE